MKTVWHSILLALILVGVASAANRIQITATLDTATHDISGWVTVTWPSLEMPLNDLRFRLFANMRVNQTGALNASSDTSYTIVDSCLANDAAIPGPREVKGTDWRTPLERTIAAGESLTVRLHFRTHVSALSAGTDRLFRSDNAYLLDGWFPMPAPRRNGEWHTVDYSELVELVADFFDFDVQFTAPESLAVIGAGLTSADTADGHVMHTYSLPSAHDFALYLAPNLVTKQYGHGAVSISVSSSPALAYTADPIADICGKTLDQMEQLVGRYPFPELHVVVCELGFFGGIELPRMIICAERSGDGQFGTRDVVTIHEVIHQWFYGVVNSDQANTPWLDEAVTDYFTERVSRSLYGESSYLSWWGWTLDYAGLQRIQGLHAFDRMPITLPAEQYFSLRTYASGVYNKGSVVLRTIFAHMQPGDVDAFWHRYYERFRFATPMESDFVALASEYQPYVGTTVVSDLLHTTQSIDYMIERISNETIDSTDTGTDTLAGESTSKIRIRSTVQYAMYNPVNLAVTLRLSFADGSFRDTLISPHAGQARLVVTGEHPVIAAALDPESRFCLDKDLLNNSLSLFGNSTSLRLFSGITFLVESLFSYVWGL